LRLARGLQYLCGMTRPRLTLGPLVVDRISTSTALALIDGLMRHGRGGFVVTPGVEQLVLAERLPRLRAAYKSASLSLGGGRGLQLLAWALGRPIPERISGPDFLFSLAQHAANRDYGVFLLGASEKVSAAVAERLTEQFPGLRIVGQDSSQWPNAQPKRLLQKVRASGANIVLVGLGCPQQEAWMLQHAEDIRPAMAFGLGNALDVVAQEAQLTPHWMSRVGMGKGYRVLRRLFSNGKAFCTGCRRLIPLFLRIVSQRHRPSQQRAAAVSV